jgi:hypothetical protein
MWKYIARVGTIVAVLAGLAAVGDVALKERERAATEQERAAKERERIANESDRAILDWEEPQVFRIIEAAGHDGVSVEFIQDKIRLQGLTAEGLTIPKEKLNDLAIRRILLSLVSRRAVTPVGTDKFRALSDADLCGGQNPLNEILNRLTAPALEYVHSVNGQKDVPQLLYDFREKFHLKEGEAQALLGNLLNTRVVGIQKGTRKVWDLLTSPDNQRELESAPFIILDKLQPQPQSQPRPGQFERRPDPADGFQPRSYDPDQPIPYSRPRPTPGPAGEASPPLKAPVPAPAGPPTS